MIVVFIASVDALNFILIDQIIVHQLTAFVM